MTDNPLQMLVRMIVGKLGMAPQPVPQPASSPRFDTSVDVHAPLPPEKAPYPSDLDTILFGSKTQLPTGTRFTNDLQPGRVVDTPSQSWLTPEIRQMLKWGPTDPKGAHIAPMVQPYLQQAYNTFTTDYPAAARMVPEVAQDPSMWGTRVMGKTFDSNNINVNPMAIRDLSMGEIIALLAHETAHAASGLNFPTPEAGNVAGETGRTLDANIFTSPVGEQQAYEVGRRIGGKYAKAPYLPATPPKK